jgi:hypothetical protein
MDDEIIALKARAIVTRSLAIGSRDSETAKLLIQLSEEFDEEAVKAQAQRSRH